MAASLLPVGSPKAPTALKTVAMEALQSLLELIRVLPE